MLEGRVVGAPIYSGGYCPMVASLDLFKRVQACPIQPELQKAGLNRRLVELARPDKPWQAWTSLDKFRQAVGSR